jgi:S1-C subfamily serine protease
MKKQTLTITGLIVVISMLLSSCSSVMALLPREATNTLSLPVSSSAAQPTAVPSQSAQEAVQPGLLAAYESALESIYSQVSPSVVNIRVVQKQQAQTEGLGQIPGLPNIPGLPGNPNNPGSNTPQYSQGLGSGFIWDKEGHIVTNNHVIDGADKIEVTFADGSTVSAELVGADPNSDLAVIKVDVAADRLQPVQLADSSQVKVGQLAIAIGNPFGLQGTMTIGIISGVGRTLPTNISSQTGPSYSIPDIIQTDAPINPGNSGGVLVNDQGQVIGVTAAIESPVQANAGIGFAIPSTIVKKVVPSLVKGGKVESPYLGISGVALTPDLAKAMNLKPDQRGALVEEVVPGGPSDKAGLHGSDKQVTIDGQDIHVGGDVIIAINDQPVMGIDDIIAYLAASTEVGQKVTLTVLRDGKETKLEVTLGSRPSVAQSGISQTKTSTVWLGITGAGLTPEIAGAMKLPADQQGVLIQQVEAGSPADNAGLRGSYKPVTINGDQLLVGGDVITDLNEQPVTGVEDLSGLLAKHKPGDKVTLTILRDGETTQVQVTLAQLP